MSGPCYFCGHPHDGLLYAYRDPPESDGYGRITGVRSLVHVTACERCREALRAAGEAGRVQKGSGVRWWLGEQ